MGIIFLLITASFTLWGVGDMFNLSGSRNAVATVNGQPITFNDFYNRYRRYIQQNQLNNLSLDNQRALGIGNQVANEMIADKIIETESKALGLQASDTALANVIRNNSLFKDETTGQFNRIQYENILRANGLTEASYTQSLSTRITNTQLLTSITALMNNTPALGRALHQIRGESRTIAYTTLTLDDVTNLPPATDEQIQSYFSENNTLYTLPTNRNVDYILLQPSDFIATIDVKQDAITNYYTQNQNLFGDAEKRSFTQYLFDSENDARQAQGQLITNANTDGLDIIDQKDVRKADLPQSMAETIFALDVNTISDPIESPFGWVLVKMNAITPAAIKPLNQVQEQIQATLASDLALDKLYETVDIIDGKTSEGQTLMEISQSLGVTVQTLQGLTPDGQIINGVTLTQPTGKLASLIADKTFLEGVTQLSEGEISLSTELSDNRFFVAQARDITEPNIPELSQIKDMVTTDYNNTRKQLLLDKRSATMVQAINNGKPLTQLAENVTVVKGLTRISDMDDSAITYGMLNTIFETQVPSAFTTTTEDKTYVVWVQSTTPAPQATDAETQENNALVSQALSNDLLESYDALLKQKYQIIINQPIINQIYIP